MSLQEQHKFLSEWHKIYGVPYILREEENGIFRIVERTSTVLSNEGYYGLCSDLDSGFEELVLGEDIGEFVPDNVKMGFLVNSNSRLDSQIVRGLRHLARLENALYVSFQSIEGNNYGHFIPFFNQTLVLPRFFNRKYDTGIDPHIV